MHRAQSVKVVTPRDATWYGMILHEKSPSSQSSVSSRNTTSGRQKKMTTKSQSARLASSELETLLM
ncbi:hypothetical protein EYF80_037672 [Liparis tanakae]|uniref:Uncharacterized protein n=1 Tax=Liparis tanakae TaxID=230148 RepID=A0A4Z2GGX2_9TELE|nr:hypothetical protein EYF80_037672 [Liparis tanakae]